MVKNEREQSTEDNRKSQKLLIRNRVRMRFRLPKCERFIVVVFYVLFG